MGIRKRWIALATVVVIAMIYPKACLGVINFAIGHPLRYRAEPIDARVVDAESEAPIAGAVVVAHWQLWDAMSHPKPVGALEILETTTDADGRFHFPAWGPKFRPWGGFLAYRDPQILIFKPGFLPNVESNDVTVHLNKASVRRSKWNGKEIPLKRPASETEYAERLYSWVRGRVDELAFWYHACEWQKIPKTLAALLDESDRLAASPDPYVRGRATGFSLVSLENDATPSRCGTIADFLGRRR